MCARPNSSAFYSLQRVGVDRKKNMCYERIPADTSSRVDPQTQFSSGQPSTRTAASAVVKAVSPAYIIFMFRCCKRFTLSWKIVTVCVSVCIVYTNAFRMVFREFFFVFISFVQEMLMRLAHLRS